jgi:hypothetical protein
MHRSAVWGQVLAPLNSSSTRCSCSGGDMFKLRPHATCHCNTQHIRKLVPSSIPAVPSSNSPKECHCAIVPDLRHWRSCTCTLNDACAMGCACGRTQQATAQHEGACGAYPATTKAWKPAPTSSEQRVMEQSKQSPACHPRTDMGDGRISGGCCSRGRGASGASAGSTGEQHPALGRNPHTPMGGVCACNCWHAWHTHWAPTTPARCWELDHTTSTIRAHTILCARDCQAAISEMHTERRSLQGP